MSEIQKLQKQIQAVEKKFHKKIEEAGMLQLELHALKDKFLELMRKEKNEKISE